MVTVGNAEGQRQFDLPELPSRAPSRSGAQRAVSVANAPAQGHVPPRRPVTQRDPWAALTALGASVRSGAHVTGHLPSLKAQHTRVHEGAAEWEHWFLKYGYLAWGYFHLAAIHAPLSFVIWATQTRTRVVVLGVLALLAWKFH